MRAGGYCERSANNPLQCCVTMGIIKFVLWQLLADKMKFSGISCCGGLNFCVCIKCGGQRGNILDYFSLWRKWFFSLQIHGLDSNAAEILWYREISISHK